MRPISEQTVLVTGATDGLGRAVALELARLGAIVLLHGRDPSRLADAAREMSQATGSNHVGTYLADLSDLAEVRRLAAAVTADHPQVDVLVNNAGIGADVPGGGVRQESADGHELRFAVNYLAGYLLTRLLLPSLRAAAVEAGSARVVMVASAGQQPLDFEDVMLNHDYSGGRAYTQSKLAQIMFAFDLAQELDGTGVAANALHPASFMPTKIVSDPFGKVSDGVTATVHLATGSAVEGVTGRYFDGLNEATAAAQAYDAGARRQLHLLSDVLTRSPE